MTHDFDGYMVPGGDKALDGNSMTGGFGTPTQEMVESYEYADGSGFPDWSAWHTAEGTTTTPPYDKKFLFIIMKRNGSIHIRLHLPGNPVGLSTVHFRVVAVTSWGHSLRYS